MIDLPRCVRSDLPRVLCACSDCESFTMTAAEKEFLAGSVDRIGEPPSLQFPPKDDRAGRPADPGYVPAPVKPPADVKAGGGGSGNPCRLCQVPAGDAFLCPGCHDQAERDLADIPALLEELTIHATGQSRFVGGASGDGLPFAEHAAQLVRVIRHHLAGFIRTLTGGRGRPVPELGSDTVAMSRWLLAHVDVLPADPAGPDIANGIRAWHVAAMQAIDAPPERVYLGLCPGPPGKPARPCGTPIHAPKDAAEFQCRTCSTTHVTAVLLEQLTNRLRDVVGSVTELEIIAKQAGYRTTRGQIEGLIRRGRLARVGRRIRPMRYRAGDLLELLEESRRKPETA